MFDPQVHTRNRNRFPEAELAKYYGKCVAWSFDGTQILASGATRAELESEIDRLGLTEYVAGYVDDPDRPTLDKYILELDSEALASPAKTG